MDKAVELRKRLGLPDVPGAADKLRSRLGLGSAAETLALLIDREVLIKKFWEVYPHLDPKNKEHNDDEK